MAFAWEMFQRTLAVEQPHISRVLQWQEAAPGNTDVMIFFFDFFFKSQKEAVQSKISGYGELFTRQAASSFFSRGEILSQHCYSKFNRKTAVSQGVVMVSKCAETDNAWQNTEATCLKRVTILILKLIVKIKKQWQENTFSILTVSW